MTQKSDIIEYRTAGHDDETDMYAVIKEAASEIPVLLDTEGRRNAMENIIIECHESGKSWVAVDANGKVVGCILARPDAHERGAISLRYIAVSKTSRRKRVFSTLIEKLKAKGVPLTASVLHNNSSAMGERLTGVGFTEVESDESETKYRWESRPRGHQP
jgi:N-acetylglutamate synthase-like GNAT family acetyltransferase